MIIIIPAGSTTIVIIINIECKRTNKYRRPRGNPWDAGVVRPPVGAAAVLTGSGRARARVYIQRS